MRSLHKRVLRLEQNPPRCDPTQWDLSALTDEEIETLIEIGNTPDDEKSDAHKETWERLWGKITYRDQG